MLCGAASPARLSPKPRLKQRSAPHSAHTQCLLSKRDRGTAMTGRATTNHESRGELRRRASYDPMRLCAIRAGSHFRNGSVGLTRHDAKADNEHFDGKTT